MGVTEKDKHSSLLRYEIEYSNRKSFELQDPGVNTIKLFFLFTDGLAK